MFYAAFCQGSSSTPDGGLRRRRNDLFKAKRITNTTNHCDVKNLLREARKYRLSKVS